MGAADLAAALAAVRTRRAEEEEDGPVDLRDAGEKVDEAAEERDMEDAARRSRDASLSRTDLIDFAQFRGLHLTKDEQSGSMDDLRKLVLDRLAGLEAG